MPAPSADPGPSSTPAVSSQLERRFGLLSATALNMSNMMGVGPFLTIPLLFTAMGGPQAMLGWVVALLITIPDSMVWSELGAALPGSGGSYVYLREGFGPRSWGRVISFLFIWQFVLSGPLEIASGYIGFKNYLGYLWPSMTRGEEAAVVAALGVGVVALLYRRIHSIAKLTLALWAGSLLTVASILVTGAIHFDPKIAFDFPAHAFEMKSSFWGSLGAAGAIGIYDYLGYYDICFLGDEVRDPGRTIPRSIFLSLLAVALIYVGVNLSIIGVIPWQEFVPANTHPKVAQFVASSLMERVYGRGVAGVFTVLVLWTTLASVFALLLGYSRIPYAAAMDGGFFSIFSRIHPSRRFPHVSLLVVGGVAIGCALLPLDDVINWLITLRILVLFIGQIVALTLLRRLRPDLPRPYRMPWYPLPSFLALFGWLFLFFTSGITALVVSAGTLGAGLMAYVFWSRPGISPRRGDEPTSSDSP
ncbi:MAG: APC family permease [Verrucomicrobia bacterium]|nr:APC family permease [Verrucomicrobiota bacterium]MBI3870784.1 APC family permease [Verrucomicrobiota bacterium]